MPTANPNVVGIVVTCQSDEVISGCLEALRSEVSKIIVIDNASTDDSVGIASNAGATLIVNHENEGYGRANNRGIFAAAGTEWCLIANPDVTIAPGCVREMLAVAERHPLATIVVPRLVEPDGRIFFRSESVLSPVAPSVPHSEACPDREGAVAFASGACMLVHRDRFLQTGGFDDKIFLFYEDDDLCLRVRRAGKAIVYAPSAVAYHRRGSSSATTRGSIFHRRFHQAWSRVYISKKYGLADDSLAVIVRNTLKLLGALMIFDRDRQERYAGSVAGALLAIQGYVAFAKPSNDRRRDRVGKQGATAMAP